ncbi:MAG TPA: hypothetical protein VFP48_00675, partial [Steroidobacteraceae bacterium]|nr:hypothetical protein [Steroidobacteraceae bacterium]
MHRLANVFEPRRRDVVEVAAGRTFRELARDLCLPEHQECGVRILHEGKRLEVTRLDETPDDGDELILVEDVQADVALSIAASIAVNLALSYATQKLFPVRKAQARGDISSPSGAWDQVQTTYGPGQVIPLNYGEPEVGGHVIYADISPKTIPGEQISTQETLNVILLIGDGRHESIGGVQGDYGGEANNLGANNDFPANVRINGSLVPSNPSTTRAWIRLGRVDQTPLPDFPDSRAVIGINAALAEGQEVIAT